MTRNPKQIGNRSKHCFLLKSFHDTILNPSQWIETNPISSLIRTWNESFNYDRTSAAAHLALPVKHRASAFGENPIKIRSDSSTEEKRPEGELIYGVFHVERAR